MANKDDLLNLNDNGGNKKNFKKPLIYGAIAFLVFIIGILGFAIYNNTRSQNTTVLPPQMKPQKQNDNTMFKQVPIEEENSTNSNNLAQKLIKKENNATKTQKKQKVQTQPAPAAPEAENTKAQAPVKKAAPKIKKEAKVKREYKQTRSVKSNYYIQVAALMKYKKPNKRFLSLIKKEGYTYRLYHTYYVKNSQKIAVTKILIGPFSKKEINSQLEKIRNSISQNAFIYRVK